MANTGKEYEFFVAMLQQAIINSEARGAQKNIVVEVNKKIIDSCGIERQFDIYWEYELGGLTYKTAIECKDYASTVTVDRIDALIGKVRDIPDLRVAVATKTGYQSGAKTKAEHNKIDLLIVREQNESDWQADDGTPYIKKVQINSTAILSARVQAVNLGLDGKWVEENLTSAEAEALDFNGLNSEVFVEDCLTKERYSLYELAQKLQPYGDRNEGEFELKQEFESAFISHGESRAKLKMWRIRYVVVKPQTQTMEIDFSSMLLGVIEYLQKGVKKSVFSNGVVR